MLQDLLSESQKLICSRCGKEILDAGVIIKRQPMHDTCYEEMIEDETDDKISHLCEKYPFIEASIFRNLIEFYEEINLTAEDLEKELDSPWAAVIDNHDDDGISVNGFKTKAEMIAEMESSLDFSILENEGFTLIAVLRKGKLYADNFSIRVELFLDDDE